MKLPNITGFMFVVGLVGSAGELGQLGGFDTPTASGKPKSKSVLVPLPDIWMVVSIQPSTLVLTLSVMVLLSGAGTLGLATHSWVEYGAPHVRI